MDKALLELGVGGIFAVLVLRVVFDYLKSRKPSGEAGVLKDIVRQQARQAEFLDILLERANHSKDVHHQLVAQTNDLHSWHAPDATGRQTWKGDTDRHERVEMQLQRIEGAVQAVANRRAD